MRIGIIAATCFAAALWPTAPVGAASAATGPVGAASAATHPATGELIEYQGFHGYLAQPEGPPRAALIVIHEWWGLNEHIRELSHRLAGEGYAALAVDLHDGKVATEPQQARELVSATLGDPQRVDAHLRAAFDFLGEQLGVERIGSIGWCFGGALSLRTALLLPAELDAAVIYYGRLVTDAAELAPLKMPILGIFGGQDSGIPLETVLQFESTLQALGKTAEIVVYEDAEHAFANPYGARYQPEAAADAWRRTLAFLEQHLARTR